MKYVYGITYERKGEYVWEGDDVFAKEEDAQRALPLLWKRDPHRFSDGKPAVNRHIVRLMVWDSFEEFVGDDPLLREG